MDPGTSQVDARGASLTSRTDAQDTVGDDVTPADIEQTRAEMSETIGAIGEKLNPHVLAEEAKDVATDVTDHAKDAIAEATAKAADHAKEAAIEIVQHVKEALPELVSNVAHKAVSGVINEAKDAIGGAVGTAKGASMNLFDRIKQNPIPAAVAGAGLYWLFQASSDSSSSGQSRNNYQTNGNGGYGQSRVQGPSNQYAYGGSPISESYDSSPGLRDKASDLADRAQDKAGDVADTVKNAAGAATDSVKNVAGAATDKVQGAASAVVDKVQDATSAVKETVQEKASQSTDWFQRTLQTNPLAIGALALAVGAAVGLAVPETDQEHRLMGETRDKLAQKASEATQNLGDKVQTVASEAMDKVKQTAQSQGLTAS